MIFKMVIQVSAGVWPAACRFLLGHENLKLTDIVTVR